jgi:hypothetical protein
MTPRKYGMANIKADYMYEQSFMRSFLANLFTKLAQCCSIILVSRMQLDIYGLISTASPSLLEKSGPVCTASLSLVSLDRYLGNNPRPTVYVFTTTAAAASGTRIVSYRYMTHSVISRYVCLYSHTCSGRSTAWQNAIN